MEWSFPNGEANDVSGKKGSKSARGRGSGRGRGSRKGRGAARLEAMAYRLDDEKVGGRGRVKGSIYNVNYTALKW